MQRGYLLHRGNAIYGLILLNHKQQAHFELALRGNAVQAVFVKAETFACVQLVILTLIVNDCFAFQCGQDGVAGGAVWGRLVPASNAISTNFMLSAWTRSTLAMLPSS